MIRRSLSGLAAILALSGCLQGNKTPEMGPKYELVSLSSLKGNPALYNGKGVEVSGIPRGVSYGSESHNYGDVAVVIEKEGLSLLCLNNSSLAKEGSRAEALIDSEMNDGDNEPILVRGIFNKNLVDLDSITANGYTIDF